MKSNSLIIIKLRFCIKGTESCNLPAGFYDYKFVVDKEDNSCSKCSNMSYVGYHQYPSLSSFPLESHCLSLKCGDFVSEVQGRFIVHPINKNTVICSANYNIESNHSLMSNIVYFYFFYFFYFIIIFFI
jgi:hypothetical protein